MKYKIEINKLTSKQYISFPEKKKMNCNCKYHKIRPRLASLVGTFLGPDEERTFPLEASPQSLLGICFVLGQISLCDIKLKTFLPLKTLEIPMHQTNKHFTNKDYMQYI